MVGYRRRSYKGRKGSRRFRRRFRRGYRRSKGRTIKKVVKAIVRNQAELKAVVPFSLPNTLLGLGSIGSGWTVYRLDTVWGFESARSDSVVGRSYYPIGVKTFGGVFQGGSTQSDIGVDPDDAYNRVRIAIIETNMPISSAALAGMTLDTPFNCRIPSLLSGTDQLLGRVKVHYDKTKFWKNNLVSNTAITPKIAPWNFSCKFKGKNYLRNPAAETQRMFYVCARSDSSLIPNPGFIAGSIHFMFKDDS